MSEETEKIAIEFAKFIIDGQWVIRKDGTWFSRRCTEFKLVTYKELFRLFTNTHERKPLFTTEDGVEIFDGDKYWFYSGGQPSRRLH